MNFLHVQGIVLHHFYLIKKSWHRLANIFYWTLVQLFVWGFITIWFKGEILGGSSVNLILVLLGALIFWELFWRSHLGISLAFLENMWSRNLTNLFITPLKYSELLVGLTIVSLVQSVISFLLVVGCAWILYALNIWALGWYLAPFLVNIFMFGWAIGFFITGLLVRFGPSMESLSWTIPFLLQPVACVFYPVTVLPLLLQKIAFFVPPMHLFEGMRAILLRDVFPLDRIIWATGLNIVYLVLSILFLSWMFRIAVKKGLLGRFLSD